MRLIDLTRTYEQLLYKLEQSEDFNMEAELDESADLLEEKLENCAWIFRNLELEADAYKAEAKRLADKSKSRELAAERLKKYIGYCLRGEPCKTKNFNFSFRKSEQVEVINLELLPEAYVRTVTKSEPNKELIKIDLKNGATIPGCGLLKNLSLQIK